MNSSPFPSAPQTSTGTQIDLNALAFTSVGGLYLLAWAWVIWYPFTWLLAGLMLMATLLTYAEERLSKTPDWRTFQEAVLVVWFVLPFALSAIYFYFFFLRP